MNGQRSRRAARCPGCGIPVETCVCAQLPRLRFATPLALVQHAREQHKPTNTGRLLDRMVDGLRVLPCGLGETFDPSPLGDPTVDWRLLYPRAGAPLVGPELQAAPGRRLGFVLLDGTWSQCSKLSHKLAVVAELPCVALPPGPPSFWTVRTQHHPQGRSTFEAALQVLELLEGVAAAAPLRKAFALVTAHMLHLKGKLSSPEVPAAWGV